MIVICIEERTLDNLVPYVESALHVSTAKFHITS